jgi:hypothetical protein
MSKEEGAVSSKELVARIDLLIKPKRHLVRVECGDRRRHERAVRAVRQRDVLIEKLRLSRQPVRRDDVVGELRARRDAARRDRRQRIEDRRQAAEVPAALRRGRNDADVHIALFFPLTFVAGEEERLVFEDGAADSAAELVALELFLPGREEISRVERVVAHELEQAAVKDVSCRFRRHVERRAGAVELG